MVDKEFKEAKNKRLPKDDDHQQAATIAVKHVISPEDYHLVEVSNIPIGATHSLTMLQAFEDHLNIVMEQVRAMQTWYIMRKVKKEMMTFNQVKRCYEWKPDCDQAKYDTQVESEIKLLDTIDPIDTDELFIHKFRHAYFQVSRGKEGKLLSILEVLSDTDLQTRALDSEEESFRKQIRRQ
jgi:hypothetical protein